MLRSRLAAGFAVMLQQAQIQFDLALRLFVVTKAYEKRIRHFYDAIFDAYHLLLSGDTQMFWAEYNVTSAATFEALQFYRMTAAAEALDYDISQLQLWKRNRSFSLWNLEMSDTWNFLEYLRDQLPSLKQDLVRAHQHLCTVKSAKRSLGL